MIFRNNFNKTPLEITAVHMFSVFLCLIHIIYGQPMVTSVTADAPCWFPAEIPWDFTTAQPNGCSTGIPHPAQLLKSCLFFCFLLIPLYFLDLDSCLCLSFWNCLIFLCLLLGSNSLICFNCFTWTAGLLTLPSTRLLTCGLVMTCSFQSLPGLIFTSAQLASTYSTSWLSGPLWSQSFLQFGLAFSIFPILPILPHAIIHCFPYSQ